MTSVTSTSAATTAYAAPTSSTGSISTPGIGSGLDVNSIVSQLVALEQAPLAGLQTKATNLNTKLSSYGTLQSQISALQTDAQTLSSPNYWNLTTAASSDATSVGVTVSGSAPVGNYAVQVQRLASAQSVASSAFGATTSTVGTGSLSIQLGSWDTAHSSFTAGSGSPVSITIDSSNNTVSGIVSAINAANAGVTASVVQDVNGARIVMSSNSTGAAQGFRVQASDSDGNNTDTTGLSSLAFDPPSGTTATSAVQDAANALATVNGLSIESATNQLTQAANGLTIQLMQKTTNPVNLSVTADKTTMTSNLQTFVTDYNTLNTTLNADLAYNATTQVGGPLQGDSTAMNLQAALARMFRTTSTASSVFSSINDLGIQFQADGSLAVNSSTLSTALDNLPEISKFFTATSTTSGQTGFAVAVSNFTNGMLLAGGVLPTQTAAINSAITQNQADQQKVTDNASAVQTRLRAQYTALDTQMASLNALNSYVSQQVTLWNNQGKNN